MKRSSLVPAPELRGTRARPAPRPAPLTDEIARLLVATGHVGARELGVLCRVSSAWRAAATDDEAWARLCARRWPNSARVPRGIVAARGHRWLYRQRQGFVLPPQPLPLAPLAPPTLSAESLVLLVDITLGGVTQLSVALKGTELETFFVDGSVELPLPHPICLGETRLTANGEFKMSKEPNDLDWGAAVHLLRTTDHKCACLFSIERTSWSGGYCMTAPDGPLEDVEPPEPGRGILDIHTNEDGLDLTPQGADVVRRRIEGFQGLYFQISADVAQPRDARYFGYRDMVAAFRAHVRGQPYSHNDFNIFACDFWEGRGNDSELDDASDGSEDEERLRPHFSRALAQPAEAQRPRVSEFYLSAWQNAMDDTTEFCNGDNNGVTLLHLLQELRAWDRAT